MRNRSPGKIPRWILPVLLVCGLGMNGCRALSYLAYGLAPESKGQWTPPQCDVLSEGKRVLVLVYADENIQYRHEGLARYNASAAIANELRSKLKVEVVDPSAVEYFQANNLNWTDMHPSQVGQRFRAEYVLYIELHEFDTQAEESGELLQGQIAANAGLYTVPKADRGKVELLWQGEARATYPADHPVPNSMGEKDRIRRETLALFAGKLVKNFYGHYEPL